MQQSLLQEKYSVFSLSISKSETSYKSVDEIIDHLKQRIVENNIAKFIAIFDHFSHTRELVNGQISEEILDAKNIIFCFGITLPDPHVMAVRPRSIGVVELQESYFLTFMEAPMPVANIAMEDWAQSIRNV